MNRVIFLDIDGVLCTDRSHMVYGVEGQIMKAWDPLGCAAIDRACSKRINLVISSTWRYEKHQRHLFEALKYHELFQYLHADWRTIDITVKGEWNDANCRGLEIKDWLDRHPEVKSYRIIDDIEQFLPDQMPFLIKTDMDEGLTSTNIRQLLRWAGYLKS